MNKSFIYTVFFLCVVALTLSSCKKEKVVISCGVPSGALEIAQPVYKTFRKTLKSNPTDNDFQKFASDISNYNVSIGGYKNKYIFVFHLKSYHGQHVLDERGGVVYSVSKDGHIQRKW